MFVKITLGQVSLKQITKNLTSSVYVYTSEEFDHKHVQITNING